MEKNSRISKTQITRCSTSRISKNGAVEQTNKTSAATGSQIKTVSCIDLKQKSWPNVFIKEKQGFRYIFDAESEKR